MRPRAGALELPREADERRLVALGVLAADSLRVLLGRVQRRAEALDEGDGSGTGARRRPRVIRRP